MDKYSFLFSDDGGETVKIGRTKAHGAGELTLDECRALYAFYRAHGIAGLYCPVGQEQRLGRDVIALAKRGVKVAHRQPVTNQGRYSVTVKIATQYKPGVCGYHATVTCKGVTKEVSDVLTEKATNRRAAVIALGKALQLIKKDADVTVVYGKPEQLGPVEYAAEHDGKTRTGKLSANAEEIMAVAPDLKRLSVSFVEDDGEVSDVRAKANKAAGDAFITLQNAEQDSASEQATCDSNPEDDKAPWDESADNNDDGTFMPF